ncbi:GNAT family N-acetyltransferase [Actinoplanes sp. NBRC 103695]|uniref:GNAT family N-acetyltransferase n=1 Tax=Actinoplanes sp. NBRC 103695 TaxID=3032202 RepID=UPI0024A596A3|nr:GNAT family N-acetyltransferase [Actinoplanes sp. NBRC 103695]GLY96540.1 hypothetical protein Acsp02_37950 [Actinoplanes sp. NBRC 103695]
MEVKPLQIEHIARVEELLALGAPYISVRTRSDYWLYATLFSTSCPVVTEGDEVIGVLIAFQSQDDPDDVYIQDVMVHPDHRRRGVARRMIEVVHTQAATWNCRRMYLTSEPDNAAAHAAWLKHGFTNAAGDRIVDGVSVISHFKGPGKHRAVYEFLIE